MMTRREFFKRIGQAVVVAPAVPAVVASLPAAPIDFTQRGSSCIGRRLHPDYELGLSRYDHPGDITKCKINSMTPKQIREFFGFKS